MFWNCRPIRVFFVFWERGTFRAERDVQSLDGTNKSSKFLRSGGVPRIHTANAAGCGMDKVEVTRAAGEWAAGRGGLSTCGVMAELPGERMIEHWQ